MNYHLKYHTLSAPRNCGTFSNKKNHSWQGQASINIAISDSHPAQGQQPNSLTAVTSFPEAATNLQTDDSCQYTQGKHILTI